MTDLAILRRDVRCEVLAVPEFEGYAVTEMGEVYSCWRREGHGQGVGVTYYLSNKWTLLKGRTPKRGRKYYTLRDRSGVYRTVYCCHVVLKAFIGPPPLGMECCHRDGNCRNDVLTNLRWGTKVSNAQDKKSHGTHLEGESLPWAKMTEFTVRELRKQYDDGEPAETLAREYGISVSNVRCIGKRETWKHVA